MSFNFPRRVKDLPKLELDSEDELNTSKKKDRRNDLDQKPLEFNKDGEHNNVNQELNNSAYNIRMVPKRRAELPMLESDSEEDLVGKNNFNCAIFNDSILASPCKSDTEYASSKKSRFRDMGSGASLLSRFNSMGIESPPLKHLQESKNLNKKGSEEDINYILSSHTENKAPVDDQFVTPQIRSHSVQRRQHNFYSAKSQKDKAAIVNEFCTQKVLFQTPMAISRNRIPQNDSISLSLCDTIIDKATLSIGGKISRYVDENQVKDSAKLKKSLEDAFVEATKETKEKIYLPANEKTFVSINQSTYMILENLGCGGSSSVYLAKRKGSDKEYALKVVDLQGDPAVVEGYLNETKLLAKLQGNICVVSLYEYQLLQKEYKLLLVMEKGDSDLNKILRSYTTNLPLYVLTNFLYQMLQAVNYIHQNGVIHSDLKPANFLMVNGRLKLIDFGIASNIAIDSTSIIKFSQAGTFNYISPEALTDTSTGTSPMRRNQPKIKISTKSDVWSLGCILYLLLYQKTPFGHIKNLYTKITAICSPTQIIEYGSLPPYYPTILVHIAKSCLQHDPKLRPSCAELLKYPFNMIIPIQNLSLPAN